MSSVKWRSFDLGTYVLIVARQRLGGCKCNGYKVDKTQKNILIGLMYFEFCIFFQLSTIIKYKRICHFLEDCFQMHVDG